MQHAKTREESYDEGCPASFTEGPRAHMSFTVMRTKKILPYSAAKKLETVTRLQGLSYAIQEQIPPYRSYVTFSAAAFPVNFDTTPYAPSAPMFWLYRLQDQRLTQHVYRKSWLQKLPVKQELQSVQSDLPGSAEQTEAATAQDKSSAPEATVDSTPANQPVATRGDYQQLQMSLQSNANLVGLVPTFVTGDVYHCAVPLPQLK